MTDSGRAVSRRAVLLSVAGTVVAASALGEPRTGFLMPGTHPGRATAAGLIEGSGGARRVTTAAYARVPFGKVTTQQASTAKRWHAPIYDLGDFLKYDHSARFPRRSVMLTIDDGPSPVWTPRYLELLAQHDVKATFNMIGEQVLPHRHLVRALVSEGHTVANHTWTHDERLPSRRRATIRREIAQTTEAIHEATGLRVTQFRAPGGVWGPRVYDELARQDLIPVDWNIDPRDWARPGTAAIKSAMLKARPGDIMLCHDGGGDRSETFHALEVVVPELKHRGFHFVTLP